MLFSFCVFQIPNHRGCIYTRHRTLSGKLHPMGVATISHLHIECLRASDHFQIHHRSFRASREWRCLEDDYNLFTIVTHCCLSSLPRSVAPLLSPVIMFVPHIITLAPKSGSIAASFHSSAPQTPSTCGLPHHDSSPELGDIRHALSKLIGFTSFA